MFIVIMWMFLFFSVLRYIGSVLIRVLFLLVCILVILFMCSIMLLISCMLYGCMLSMCLVVLCMVVKVFGRSWLSVLLVARCCLNLLVLLCRVLLFSVVYLDFSVLMWVMDLESWCSMWLLWLLKRFVRV